MERVGIFCCNLTLFTMTSGIITGSPVGGGGGVQIVPLPFSGSQKLTFDMFLENPRALQ